MAEKIKETSHCHTGRNPLQKSGAGVIFVINFPQMLSADMRINLSGGDLAVPEHELDRPKIGSPLQKMGGKRVAENVGADLFP